MPDLPDSFGAMIYYSRSLLYYGSYSNDDFANRHWAHSTYARNRNALMASNDSNKNCHSYCYYHTVVAAVWPVADNFYHKFLLYLYYAMTTYIKFYYYH